MCGWMDPPLFEEKGAEKTVRGRSWAIQDGILGKPWESPKLYKPVGKEVGVNTFDGNKIINFFSLIFYMDLCFIVTQHFSFRCISHGKH